MAKTEAQKKAEQQKNDLASLKKQQDDEIKLLKFTAKESGLSSKEISALVNQEKTANKTEYNEAKKTGTVLKNENKYVYSDLAVAKAAGLLPKAQEVAQETASRVQEALAFLDANDLQQNAAKKGVGTGIMGGYVLSEMSNAATPAEALQIAKTLGAKRPSEAVKIVEELKTSTPQEGEKVKQVKDNAGIPQGQGSVVYTSRKVGDGRTLSTVYLQTPDGKFQELGNTYQSVNTKEGIGIIGQLALGALGAFVLGPAIGAAFGGGSTGAIAGGALSGGITSELGGGDFLQGAALGAAGGAFNTSVADSISSNMVRSIQESLASSLGDQLANIVARSATSATLGAVESGILGGDVLTGAGLSALGSATQSAVGNALNQLNLPPGIITEVARAASNAAAAGVVAAAQGTDVGLAVGSSLGSSGLQAVGETFFAGNRPSGPAPIEERDIQGRTSVAGAGGADRVVGPVSELDSSGFYKTGLTISGQEDFSPEATAAAQQRAQAIRDGKINAFYIDNTGRRIITVGEGVVIESGASGSGKFVDAYTGAPVNISTTELDSVQKSLNKPTFNLDQQGNVTGSTQYFGGPNVPAPPSANVATNLVTSPSGAAASQRDQDILNLTGITGGTSGRTTTPSIDAGQFVSNLQGSDAGQGANTSGDVGTGTGAVGTGGGAGGTGPGGKGTDMAPPVDVIAPRETDVAPPVDVIAPKEGEEPLPPEEGKTTYFGGPDTTVSPTTPKFDNTLITFLGLTEPPAQKKTPLRGAPPGLITGSEDADLSALFGGKPEELQDVWNQQSLRLRSALGI